MNAVARKYQPGTRRAAVSSRGFTLIELLVVIAIIGILVALIPPIEPPPCFPHCGEATASEYGGEGYDSAKRSCLPHCGGVTSGESDRGDSAAQRWAQATNRVLRQLQPTAAEAERKIEAAKASGGTVDSGWLRRLHSRLASAEREIGVQLQALARLRSGQEGSDWRFAKTEELQKLHAKLGLARRLADKALRERSGPPSRPTR